MAKEWANKNRYVVKASNYFSEGGGKIGDQEVTAINRQDAKEKAARFKERGFRTVKIVPANSVPWTHR